MTKKIAVKQKTARKRAPGRPLEAAAAKKTQTKRTPTKTAPPAPRKPVVAQPIAAQRAYHFNIATTAVPRIVQAKAGRGQSSGEFASFDEAKDRAIDFLIDFIADCERDLWDLKRSESYEAYAAFLAAAESQKT